MNSILTKRQKKKITKEILCYDKKAVVTAHVRYDDECGNGHNTFTITSDFKYTHKRCFEAFGADHGLIRKYFPELAHLIPWHLVSSDGPMHYIANTIYHAKNGSLEFARSTAVWPDATLEQLSDREQLEARLPSLLEEFKNVIEQFGFTY